MKFEFRKEEAVKVEGGDIIETKSSAYLIAKSDGFGIQGIKEKFVSVNLRTGRLHALHRTADDIMNNYDIVRIIRHEDILIKEV